MKLLARLRKLRESHFDHFAVGLIETDDEHFGVGTTTVDDIIRLNLEHINLQEQAPRAHFVF